MVTDTTGYSNEEACYVIQPNPPMSWKMLCIVFAIMSSVILACGIFFYTTGLTLILPFAGLDVLVLGYALYITAKNAKVREVVRIQPCSVVVERGHWRPETITEFERAWFRLDLIKSNNGWHPSQLIFRSGDKQLEIGKFLVEEERQDLAKLLDKEIWRSSRPDNNKDF